MLAPVRSRGSFVFAAALPSYGTWSRTHASRWSEGMRNVCCKLPGSTTKVAIKPEDFIVSMCAFGPVVADVERLTSLEVPFDMAVEEVNTRIAGLEANGQESIRKDGDGITAQWAVALGREILPMIITTTWAVSVYDLEGVAVKMEGVVARLSRTH